MRGRCNKNKNSNNHSFKKKNSNHHACKGKKNKTYYACKCQSYKQGDYNKLHCPITKNWSMDILHVKKKRQL